MIVEQVRYFAAGDDLEGLIEVRRQIGQVRESLGLPPGHILIADAEEDEAPCLVWQCLYTDEAEMGSVETRLIGNEGYEEARGRLATFTGRVELEVYTTDEPPE